MGTQEEAGSPRPRHPIGVVSDRTGLTPDVIRVWERRYGAVEPARDSGGNRLYTDADVSRLELLARAVEGGRSIGRIVGLDDDAVAELVRGDAAARWRASRPSVGGPEGEAGEDAETLVDRAMDRIRGLDAGGLERVLDRALMLLGVRSYLEDVVAPLFRRVGDEWHAGTLSVAQEHLASGVTIPALGRLRSRLPGSPDAPLLAVATPTGERHEVGALLVAAAAAAEGWRVLYLGADLPAAEIGRAVRESGARAVALSVVRTADAEARALELAGLARDLEGRCAVLLGGAGAEALRPWLEGEAVEYLDGLAGVVEFLRR